MTKAFMAQNNLDADKNVALVVTGDQYEHSSDTKRPPRHSGDFDAVANGGRESRLAKACVLRGWAGHFRREYR
jgi:hypothetical protein